MYILSERGASSEAARFLADRENSADLKGVSLAGRSDSLASVLVNLSQSAAIGSSVEAADVVLGALDRVGAVRKRQVQQAGFVVLKSPDMPSMLVETAYISNPGEERKLRSAAYQHQLASAIGALVIQATTTSSLAIGVPANALIAVKAVVVIVVILLYSQQVRDFVRKTTSRTQQKEAKS